MLEFLRFLRLFFVWGSLNESAPGSNIVHADDGASGPPPPH